MSWSIYRNNANNLKIMLKKNNVLTSKTVGKEKFENVCLGGCKGGIFQVNHFSLSNQEERFPQNIVKTFIFECFNSNCLKCK